MRHTGHAIVNTGVAGERNPAGEADVHFDPHYDVRPFELRPPTDAIKDRMIARLIKKMARPGQSLLDIGCGMGQLAARLSPFVAVTGFDISADAVAIAGRKSTGRFFQGDAQALAFADKSFDFVIAKDVIEHVPDDNRAMDEIARVSKDHARVILYIPCTLSGFNLSTEAIAKRLTGYTIDPEVGHLRRYSLAEARALLLKHGLVPGKSWYVVHFSLGIMALITVKGFSALKKEKRTGLLSNRAVQPLVKLGFGVFQVLGEIETALLQRLPGAGFFVVAEKTAAVNWTNGYQVTIGGKMVE